MLIFLQRIAQIGNSEIFIGHSIVLILVVLSTTYVADLTSRTAALRQSVPVSGILLARYFSITFPRYFCAVLHIVPFHLAIIANYFACLAWPFYPGLTNSRILPYKKCLGVVP
jgi:hypothetical protein